MWEYCESLVSTPPRYEMSRDILNFKEVESLTPRNYSKNFFLNEIFFKKNLILSRGKVKYLFVKNRSKCLSRSTNSYETLNTLVEWTNKFYRMREPRILQGPSARWETRPDLRCLLVLRLLKREQKIRLQSTPDLRFSL